MSVAKKTMRQPVDVIRAQLLSAVEERGAHLETISRILGRGPTFMADFIYKAQPALLNRVEVDRIKEILNAPNLVLPMRADDVLGPLDGTMASPQTMRSRAA